MSDTHSEVKKTKSKFRKKQDQPIDITELAKKIKSGSITDLSKAITMIESRSDKHRKESNDLLETILPYTGKSIRIGISGVPGAGKSTFIESFGLFLCELGYKVAVLAVDPSSPISGGSILGDKTRMEELSRHPLAFIRPTPSEGTLGGVHRKTLESMMLCEAAGYSIVLVETVGVGQSEAEVRDMVDFFLLLALTGAGDELQGMKKGILELVDTIIINKADGDNLDKALKAKHEYQHILHDIKPATPGWQAKTFTCSSLYRTGLDDIWKCIRNFIELTTNIGVLEEKRKKQLSKWLQKEIKNKILEHFYSDPEIKKLLPVLEQKVMNGDEIVSNAANQLLKVYFSDKEQ